MRPTIPVAATLLVVTLSAALLAADNWPHWPAPEPEAPSKEVGLVRTWSPTANIAWKVPTPSRTGSAPVIWGDTVFLIVATADSAGDLQLWAIDRNKQAVTWKKPLGSAHRASRTQNVPSPSPVTDGRTVWVMTGTGTIKAFDFAGNEKQNAADYHLMASPTVWKGIVIAPARVQPMLAFGIPPPVLADGHIYVTNEEGLTSVYRAGAKFELVAQNALDGDGLSSIAISEGQIFVRTSKHLWAIGHRKK